MRWAKRGKRKLADDMRKKMLAGREAALPVEPAREGRGSLSVEGGGARRYDSPDRDDVASNTPTSTITARDSAPTPPSLAPFRLLGARAREEHSPGG